MTTDGFLELSRQAIDAVNGLWAEGHPTFWRDTAQRERTSGNADALYPTVTCRCVDELLAARQKVAQFPIDDKTLTQMSHAVAGVDPDDLLKDSELGYKPFTLALAAACCSRIATSQLDTKGAAQESIEPLVSNLLAELQGIPAQEVHPFVRFHVLRALTQPEIAARAVPGAAELHDEFLEAIRRDTSALLAKHFMATISPAEHVALAFCAACLSRADGAADRKTALAALQASASAQDSAGCWPLGRVVRTEPSRLEISTYEVGWAICDSLRRLIEAGLVQVDSSQSETLLTTIDRAAAFAVRSVVDLSDGRRGWASDHPFQQPQIESWTSAIVLQFALAGEELRAEVEHLRTLSTFNVLDPRSTNWPNWLRWNRLTESGEPDPTYPVYEYLENAIVGPIRSNPDQLPSGSASTTSALLFGPPGTSKTTVAKAVADALQWPVVQLSPGTFIEKGLEAIEAEARSVFDRLQQLQRAVVLFDECDELFRDRDPSRQPEGVRTISAFVTGSMLPKLQDLHDTGRVVFFVCTNHVSAIDPAIRRGGRIDHRIAVGPPGSAARQKIIDEAAAEVELPDHWPAAAEALAHDSERFIRSELRRAVRVLLDAEAWPTAEKAAAAAKAVAKSLRPSLTVTDKLYSSFEADRRNYSDL